MTSPLRRNLGLAAVIAVVMGDMLGSGIFFTAGKYADITVLSKDILTIPDDEIRDTEVVYTIIGGEVKHEAR